MVRIPGSSDKLTNLKLHLPLLRKVGVQPRRLAAQPHSLHELQNIPPPPSTHAPKLGVLQVYRREDAVEDCRFFYYYYYYLV